MVNFQGAQEFVVPTRNSGLFYSLPQSPQQFKQLLMVGGIDRYMQIARCFRDEASRADRQPEFTQLDLEMSFVSMEDIFQVIQNTLSACWDLIRKVKSDESADHPSFDRMKYQTCMSRFGTDKPDIRFEFSFCEPTKSDLIGFSVPASHAVFLSHSDWKKIRRSVKDASGSDITSFKTAFAPSDFNELVDALQANPDDYVVFIRGSSNSQKKSLGLARTEVAKMLHEKGDSIYKPGLHFLWVSDFPLFELDETGNLASVHHPFTAPTEATLPLIYSEPLSVVGQHYDLVCNGQEVGGGSIRIHDPQLQEYVLQDILRENTEEMEHFLLALRSGAPPHGGIALGLDRLISIFLDANSIRDVIAFPKAAGGKDLMCGAPTMINDEYLELYKLKVIK
ncbi:Aspartyl trna synthetase mitochondrial [Fasciola hepatica]|uniref:Aspartyl trna synthetase mitochondrial n=1 Tax=Fasciola hepatica TaxID=6192 RepID=A0A4E0RUL5_FASHE|nr:Aspartyl trna synthetase mitochondrial [Fasciola hepatica]